MKKNNKVNKKVIIVIIIVVLILLGVWTFFYESRNTEPLLTAQQFSDLTWQQTFFVVGLVFSLGYFIKALLSSVIIKINNIKP